MSHSLDLTQLFLLRDLGELTCWATPTPMHAIMRASMPALCTVEGAARACQQMHGSWMDISSSSCGAVISAVRVAHPQAPAVTTCTHCGPLSGDRDGSCGRAGF